MAAPDRIFVEGRFYRHGIDGRPAEALAVSAGRVTAIGGLSEVRGLAGPQTVVEGLGGSVVVPGFHDAHLHLASGSVVGQHVDLRACAGPEEAAARVARRAAEAPEGGWIRGWGWDHSRWPVSGWPGRGPLDRAVPRHPVYLSRIDGHVAWVNGAALRAVGFGPHTPDPEGGRIVRDPDTGACTGILLERAAEIARERVPRETDAERVAALEWGLGELRRFGITSIEDVLAPWALPLYRDLQERGRLTARVSSWLPLDMDLDEAREIRERFPRDDPWVAVGTLKAFLDGTLGARTAALAEPYDDLPDERGELRVEPRRLAGMARAAAAAGWSVALHAIGDRAVGVALDALDSLPVPPHGGPHRIEHLQVVAPRDVTRLAGSRIAASIQPVHFREDCHWIERRLGNDRARRAYPWRSLVESGSIVAFGTDWPVAPLDPLQTIETAVGRDGPESLGVREAWAAYTLGSSRAAGRQLVRGTLDPGRDADFVVLSDDPRRIDPAEPGRVEVVRTYVGGRCVHPTVVRRML